MEKLLIYTYQVSIVAICAYVIYRIAFAGDAFHKVKRFVLLFFIGLSFLLPICKITIHKEIFVENAVNTLLLNNTNSHADIAEIEEQPMPVYDQIQTTPTRAFDWFALILIIYITGAVVVLSYSLIGISRIKSLLKRATVSRQALGSLTITVVNEEISPFSFIDNVVISEKDFKENADMIIRHEQVHIIQRHYLDLLFINIALSLQWFNPIMWFLRRELVLTHEYEADRGVIQSGFDAKKYQYLLISKAASDHVLIPVTNQFGNSDLLKRIKTMKKKSSKFALLKLLVILPLVLLAFAAFSQTKYKVITNSQEQAREAGSVEEKGKIYPEHSETFFMPYQGSIIGKYGKQIDPVIKKTRNHIGIDVLVTNDTIKSPFSGIVKFAGSDTGYGNKLVIAHKNGLETTYGHLSSFFVGEGDKVIGGSPIAIVGNTGRATGTHLHFECKLDGKLVDPEATMPLSNEWFKSVAKGNFGITEDLGYWDVNGLMLFSKDTVRTQLSGMVVKAGFDRKYGYMVLIDHGLGKRTIHGFVSQPLVSAGSKVEVGDVIAVSGDTKYYPKAYYYELRNNDKVIASRGWGLEILKL